MAYGAADGGHPFFIGIYMLSSILSIGYLMPVVARAFFFPPKDDHHDDHPHHPVKESFLLCGPPVITAVGCLVLFFVAQDIHALLSNIQWGG